MQAMISPDDDKRGFDASPSSLLLLLAFCPQQPRTALE